MKSSEIRIERTCEKAVFSTAQQLPDKSKIQVIPDRVIHQISECQRHVGKRDAERVGQMADVIRRLFAYWSRAPQTNKSTAKRDDECTKLLSGLPRHAVNCPRQVFLDDYKSASSSGLVYLNHSFFYRDCHQTYITAPLVDKSPYTPHINGQLQRDAINQQPRQRRLESSMGRELNTAANR